MNVIITGANSNHFEYLELFVRSLRENGQYEGVIAVCDNLIDGEWNRPGSFRDGISFTEEQIFFLSKYEVTIYSYSELLAKNNIERKSVELIPSPTQRFPHKFFYTTLISKEYLRKAKNICYFDADVYFQKPVQPLFDAFHSDELYIVGENWKIGKSPFLSKWIAHSDFSRLSDQKYYMEQMYKTLDYCSGFFGGDVHRFHTLCLLCTLLSSNQLVSFFSDQPTINILKTFFGYPFQELSKEYVFHLGEFPKEDFVIQYAKLSYKGMESIAVHFNGPNKDTFEEVWRQYTNNNSPARVEYSAFQKGIIKSLRALRKIKRFALHGK